MDPIDEDIAQEVELVDLLRPKLSTKYGADALEENLKYIVSKVMTFARAETLAERRRLYDRLFTLRGDLNSGRMVDACLAVDALTNEYLHKADPYGSRGSA